MVGNHVWLVSFGVHGPRSFSETTYYLKKKGPFRV